jgi:hypothetical protein
MMLMRPLGGGRGVDMRVLIGVLLGSFMFSGCSKKEAPVPVKAANHPPRGADRRIVAMKNARYVFSLADFGFSDPQDKPANAFAAVVIERVPARGILRYDAGAVSSGQVISAADVARGLLSFTPSSGAAGADYASLDFRVQDDGGGADVDPKVRRIVVSIDKVPERLVTQMP